MTPERDDIGRRVAPDGADTILFRIVSAHAWTVAIASLAAALIATAYAADHRDDPTQTDAPATDLGSLYAWKRGTSLVVAVTVNPLSGPIDTEDFRFSETAEYRIHLDTDGVVATDEQTWIAQFASQGSEQWIRLSGVAGREPIVGRINVAADGEETRIVRSDETGTGRVTVFAGPRDDPFFFSLAGEGTSAGHRGFAQCTAGGACLLGRCDDDAGCLYLDSAGNLLLEATPYPETAVDSYAGTNVSAIVVEVPLADLGPATRVNLWASTHDS